jgi:DNA mismatch repair ATPase MutL
MSDDEPKDESTGDSEQQSDQEPSDRDQPSAQSDDAPADSDQSTEQSEEQPADSDQSAEQQEEQPAASNQAAEQSEEQPAESDHAAEQSGDATGGGGGGGGSGEGFGGGGPADDAVAADSSSQSTRPLRVIAVFTQEGQKFIGDITIEVSEWTNGRPGKSRFPTASFLQDTAGSKGNVIDTNPIPGGVPGEKVLIRADARVALVDLVDKSGQVPYQYCSRSYVIPMPSGTDVLPVKFDVEVQKLDPQTVTVDKKKVDEVPGGNEADAAKNMVRQSPQLKGHLTFDLDATPLGNHKFRVIGKYLTGDIRSSTGEKFIP